MTSQLKILAHFIKKRPARVAFIMQNDMQNYVDYLEYYKSKFLAFYPKYNKAMAIDFFISDSPENHFE